MSTQGSMGTIRVHIPYDTGFPGSGGGMPINLIFDGLSNIVMFFRPFKRYRQQKEIERCKKEFQERMLAQGKNKDGSEDKEYPANMLLRDLLLSLRFDLWKTREWPSMCDIEHLERTGKILDELTPEEIEETVMWAQMCEW